jgi:D-3-phosphoglycerate dehydrogenase
VTVRVLVTDPVADDLVIEESVLGPAGIEIMQASDLDEEALSRSARAVDAILVTYATISAAVIDAAERCRVISRLGIGIDNIDVDAATRAGIYVTNVPDYCLDEVADHTLALLLGFERGVVRASSRVREGGWDGGRRPIHRLAGRQLALIGAGAVGRRVALRAAAFGMRVVACDPYVQTIDVPGVALVSTLTDAVADADFVSLHAPLTAATRHIIDEESLSLMRGRPIVLNTARGGLIDTDALLAALDSGQVGGAALDVTEPEPLPHDHPLRTHPHAIVTPHMAFYSVEAAAELRRRGAQAVVDVLSGSSPSNPVNRPPVPRG